VIAERTYWKVEHLSADSCTLDDSHVDDGRKLVSESEANLVSSRLVNDMHAPAIDIDLPCKLIESSTPGHFHLYIEKEMTWAKYQALLLALADAGVVENNYAKSSIRKGQSFLRKTGVSK
jgi:hypothetical protein